MIDGRLLRVGIEVEGETKLYEDLSIECAGSKYASLTQNETLIKIANVEKETRDFLLSEGTPFNRRTDRVRQRIFIETGRESYGYTRVFDGDITTVSQSQPPDIILEIKALTSQFDKGKIISVTGKADSAISEIADRAASELGLDLVFEARDRNVQSFSYSGSATKILDEIMAFGGLDVYVNDSELIIKDTNSPLNVPVKTISSANGSLIGTPEFNDFGVNFTTLLMPDLDLGMEVDLISELYPAVSGRYVIYRLSFNWANREIPFYYIAEGRRRF